MGYTLKWNCYKHHSIFCEERFETQKDYIKSWENLRAGKSIGRVSKE